MQSSLKEESGDDEISVNWRAAILPTLGRAAQCAHPSSSPRCKPKYAKRILRAFVRHSQIDKGDLAEMMCREHMWMGSFTFGSAGNRIEEVSGADILTLGDGFPIPHLANVSNYEADH